MWGSVIFFFLNSDFTSSGMYTRRQRGWGKKYAPLLLEGVTDVAGWTYGGGSEIVTCGSGKWGIVPLLV